MLQLKQLKTVELVIIDSQLHTFEDFLDQLTAALNNFCAFHIVFQLGNKLRNLEKIVLKLYLNRRWVELDADFLKSAPRLQYFNDVLSRSLREDLKQVCCTPFRAVYIGFFFQFSNQILTDDLMMHLAPFSPSNSGLMYLTSTLVQSILVGLCRIGSDTIAIRFHIFNTGNLFFKWSRVSLKIETCRLDIKRPKAVNAWTRANKQTHQYRTVIISHPARPQVMLISKTLPIIVMMLEFMS